MPSDFIEDLEDKKGTTVTLTMKSSGHATLTLASSKEHDWDRGPDLVDFHLPPNEEGLRAAEQIERALADWREIVGSIRENGR